MTDHAAVCASPDDDTPRLALADWLEENGRAKALAGSPYFAVVRRINATGRGTAQLRKHFGKKVVP